jgi:hypothetical protein
MFLLSLQYNLYQNQSKVSTGSLNLKKPFIYLPITGEGLALKQNARRIRLFSFWLTTSFLHFLGKDSLS